MVILTPDLLGEQLRGFTQQLMADHQTLTPQAALYAEKPGGFQCRTCCHAVPVNASHGRCILVCTTVSLDNGCCALWDANKALLHLYQEKDAS